MQLIMHPCRADQSKKPPDLIPGGFLKTSHTIKNCNNRPIQSGPFAEMLAEAESDPQGQFNALLIPGLPRT
jgi:hypothetical protein